MRRRHGNGTGEWEVGPPHRNPVVQGARSDDGIKGKFDLSFRLDWNWRRVLPWTMSWVKQWQKVGKRRVEEKTPVKRRESECNGNKEVIASRWGDKRKKNCQRGWRGCGDKAIRLTGPRGLLYWRENLVSLPFKITPYCTYWSLKWDRQNFPLSFIPNAAAPGQGLLFWNIW